MNHHHYHREPEEHESELQRRAHAGVRFAKKHGAKAAWSTTLLSVTALFINAYFEHHDSASKHNASWDRINALENRVRGDELQIQHLQDTKQDKANDYGGGVGQLDPMPSHPSLVLTNGGLIFTPCSPKITLN